MLLEIFDPKAPPKPIGIDLGTTHSLVAFMRDDGPVCIADCNAEMLVPSVVHYGELGEVLVGSEAKARAQSWPEATIASAKRFMGRGADDAETRRPSPYRFVPRTEGGPNVVRFGVPGRAVTPVEVSAEILRELRRRAADELDAVGGAVITVPAYFDDAQRQATKDAGKLAGIEVLRLLNEPTAAALAYGLDRKKNGCFVVYDLGGGTFDVTVLLLDDGVFQVKSTGGDSALGGDDMDHALAEELAAGFGLGSLASLEDPAALRALLDLARVVKHQLSDADSVQVTPPEMFASASPLELDRARFDALIEPLLARTGVACRRALRDAELEATALDGIILVGGATRVPAVRSYVQKLFGKALLADIDPDQVVALGAAVQANMLAGTGSVDDVLLLDVLPLSIGIEVGGGVVDKVLPRNTTIPTQARALYTTQADNQTGFLLHVVQGERELAEDCRSLARFTLKGIPPLPAGVAKLAVSFEVDENSLLHVTAREETTGIEQRVEVVPSYGLDDETVEQMLLDAYDHGEEDLQKRRVAEARVEGARIVLAVRKSLIADADLLEAGERENIEAALQAFEAGDRAGSPDAMNRAITAIDEATQGFAGRRMNRAILQATAGRSVGEVEEKVASALDAEQAHARGGFST